MTRVITTLIGIPLLIFIIEFAPDSVAIGLIFVCMLLALHEYFSMAVRQKQLALQLTGFVLASAVVACFYFSALFSIFWLPAASMLILIVALFSRGELKDRWEAAALVLFGVWYVGGLMGYMVGIRRIDHGGKMGADLLMLLLVIIWANDIFAYLIGRTLGRHKLAPIVSPKKTVEGAVAGLLFGILASYASRWIFIPQISAKDSILMALLIGVLGQIGDLCESIVKRSANVKDSGGIVPGHGGMLDRVDSLLFGAPAMYYYFYLVLLR
jgi:phosphatidate cytidylyltransferase